MVKNHLLSKASITSARLSRHGLGWIPKTFLILEQSSAEFAGLVAGVGYSAVLIGNIRFTAKESYFLAISKMVSAKPCHEVTPSPQ